MSWGRKASWRHGAESVERLVQQAIITFFRVRHVSEFRIFETKSLNKNILWL